VREHDVPEQFWLNLDPARNEEHVVLEQLPLELARAVEGGGQAEVVLAFPGAVFEQVVLFR
jgi:hypothetical protein